MKKKKNSFIGDLIFVLAFSVGSLFTYLFTLNEIKILASSKDNLENLLAQKANKKELLIVEAQGLKSENRIVNIAVDSLGLVRADYVYKEIFVDEKQVDRVKRIVNDKYE